MSSTTSNPKRLVMVGAGSTGRALLRVLSPGWEVAVLDTDQARLDQLRAESPAERPLRLLCKDGTSQLNLREAGVEGATWVAALTHNDAVNVEVCRLALASTPPTAAIGVVSSAEAAQQLKELGAEVLTRAYALAGLISNHIERGLRVAVSVGLGRGEIVEIPVLPSSPAVDTRVADLRAHRWLVAAVYRDDQILIPHGAMIIRQGDRLLLSGEPDILPYIADYLRAGVARFPLQYGRTMVALPGSGGSDAFWSEIRYLGNHTRATELRIVSGPGARAPVIPDLTVTTQTLAPRQRPSDALRESAINLDCGCLVIPKRRASLASRLGLSRPRDADLLELLPCPTLLSAGTHPYRRIVLPVTDSAGAVLAADLAIDLARQLSLPLVTVTVSAPAFVVGQDAVDEQKQALRTVADAAALYHLGVEQIQKEGNPVIEICQLVGPGDLLLVASKAGRRPSLFTPDTSMLLIDRASCSVLVLSYRERAHGAK